MKCLTRDECAQYTRGLGFSIGDHGMARSLDQLDGGASAWMRVPDSPGDQRALVDRALELYGSSRELMLWVCQKNASWVEEYAEVLHQVRLAEGEGRSLVDAPGHLFCDNEEGLARGMVLLVLVLQWDFCLAGEGMLCLLSQSNGDRLTIAARDRATISGIVSKLENAGFHLDQ